MWNILFITGHRLCNFYSMKGKKKKLTRTHAIIDLICTADYSLKLAQHGINFKN